MTTGFSSNPTTRKRARRNPSVAGVPTAAGAADASAGVGDDGPDAADDGMLFADTDQPPTTSSGADGEPASGADGVADGDGVAAAPDPTPPPARKALVVINRDGTVTADDTAHVCDLRTLDDTATAEQLLDVLKALAATADTPVRDTAATSLIEQLRTTALAS